MALSLAKLQFFYFLSSCSVKESFQKWPEIQRLLHLPFTLLIVTLALEIKPTQHSLRYKFVSNAGWRQALVGFSTEIWTKSGKKYKKSTKFNRTEGNFYLILKHTCLIVNKYSLQFKRYTLSVNLYKKYNWVYSLYYSTRLAWSLDSFSIKIRN